MPVNPEDFASMVVLTIKAALAPVLERLSASEQRNKDLQARLDELSGLRDRVTVVETKAAMPAPAIEVPDVAPILARLTAIEAVTDGWSAVRDRVTAVEIKAAQPVVTPTVETVPGPTPAEIELALRDRLEPLTKQIAGLSERVAVIEVKAPVPGPAGANGVDGRDGKDGADGLGFDDLDVKFDGARTISFELGQGDRKKTWPLVLPYQWNHGVYTEGKTYVQGDVVTWGGSQWHANETTTAKPGEGSKAWTLIVKRGRDGKDGKDAVTMPVVSVGGGR